MTRNIKIILFGLLVCLSANLNNVFAAEPLTFSFSGQITERRTEGSVFSGNIDEQFSGYFSYDPDAIAIDYGSYYPLLDFTVDGKSLNFATGSEIPYLPGVIVHDGFDDFIEIRGFYLPAVGQSGENGATSIYFADWTGSVFNDNSLPTTLSLSSFNDKRLIGPIFGASCCFQPTRDEGIITQLNIIPEPIISFDIDIKSGSDPNSINLKSKGVIPVAILTTDDFDATTVDPLSVEFGPNGAMEAHGKGHIEDVDGDGDLDLVLHFKTQETGIACGDTEAGLTGETFGGQPIEGFDSINIVRCM